MSIQGMDEVACQCGHIGEWSEYGEHSAICNSCGHVLGGRYVAPVTIYPYGRYCDYDDAKKALNELSEENRKFRDALKSIAETKMKPDFNQCLMGTDYTRLMMCSMRDKARDAIAKVE